MTAPADAAPVPAPKAERLTSTVTAPDSSSDTAPTTPLYFGVDVPFMATIGLQPLHLDAQVCRTRLCSTPALVNSRGHLHGGTLMSALDFTMSAAARGHEPLRWGVMTLDMATQFLDPAVGEVLVTARCTRRGRSLAFCDGEVVDASGTVVAAARAVFKLLRKDVPGPSPGEACATAAPG